MKRLHQVTEITDDDSWQQLLELYGSTAIIVHKPDDSDEYVLESLMSPLVARQAVIDFANKLQEGWPAK